MKNRFFIQDKNYILKQAQADAKRQGLELIVKETLNVFMLNENPMGLQDDLIVSLTKKKKYNLSPLEEFYTTASGIYRLLHGDNQLEFLWDGNSHYDHYKSEWVETLKKWTRRMALNKSFSRAILKTCVLFPNESHPLIESQLNRMLLSQFNLKLNRKKQLVKVA